MSSGFLPPWVDLDVERLRGVASEDSHGAATIDWTTPDVLLIEGCWIGRPSGIEIVAGRQTVITEQWWWGPEDADVVETDRLRDVEFGVTYEVDGPILVERDLADGLNTHKTCQLRMVTG